jgi:HEPN domain-containing protein
MVQRAQDWFRQAERDLEQAEDSRRAGGTNGHASLPSRPPRKR